LRYIEITQFLQFYRYERNIARFLVVGTKG
jgi:hypothetical protein